MPYCVAVRALRSEHHSGASYAGAYATASSSWHSGHYAVVFGGLMLALAFRLYSRREEQIRKSAGTVKLA